jgi:hypothetical protein
MLIKVVAYAAVGVLASTGTAAPVPRPPARHEPARPRGQTIISCQSDDTEQVDEFGDDDEPRHTVTGGPTSTCPQKPATRVR